MVFETQLTRNQFIKLALIRHFSRANFYFLAATCSLFTAYAIYKDAWLLLLAIWPPFLLYIAFGVVSVFRQSSDPNKPFFLPTRYELTETGLLVRTEQGQSELPWEEFISFRMMSGCYVLYLESGPMLAIPQEAVPEKKVEAFEKFVEERLARSKKKK